MKKIKFLRSGAGDWVGLYIDGKLIREGHSISEEEIVSLLFPKVDIETVYGSEALEEYGNHCPSKWSEVLEKHE